MTINAEIQKLEPGEWVELLVFDGTEIGAGVLRFHPYLQMGNIFWQGEEYAPYPHECKGFQLTPDQPPTPKISVANIDRSITLLCAFFDDMVGAKIIRKRTLGKFLDAANFGGVNPTADPDEQIPDDVWYIERKVEENNEYVTFELSTGMNLTNMTIPARQIIANNCPWAYRGPECGYAGPAVAKDDDTPTSNMALDACGKRIYSCQLRFGVDNPLPTGAFPAAGLNR